ncbi:MAG: hypothetical protein ACI8YQ_003357 [Polaribacter sp.]|jgi:hypothetical protein
MMKKQIKTFSILALLPVTLLLSFNVAQAQVVDYEKSLAASEDGVGFILKWTTSDDLSTDSFVVERSKGGEEFKTIGMVMGRQSKKLTEYTFKDLDLGLKKVRYRLKEVSTGGSSSFTEAVVMTKEFVSNFAVVNKQQIAEGVMEISISSIVDGELECRVIDNMGDVLIEELRKIEVGLNDIVFDLSSEADGTYHMIFKQDNIMETVVLKKEMKDKKANVAKTKTVKSGG